MKFSRSFLFTVILLVANESLAAKKEGLTSGTRRKAEDEKIADGAPIRNTLEVSVQYYVPGKRYHHCVGQLLTVTWVLTAAHCLYEKFPYLIVAGDEDAYGSGAKRQIHFAKWLTVHNSFDVETYANDIGLIQLKTAVTLNKKIELSTLADLKYVVPEKCIATGWGETSDDREETKRATGFPDEGAIMTTDPKNKSRRSKVEKLLFRRVINIPIVGYQECSDSMRNKSSKRVVGDKSTICAGGEAGRGSCDGDDGGPLLCANGQKSVVLTGIRSYGKGCGREGFPSVYTKVAAYRKWIDYTIRVNTESYQ